MQSNDRQKRGEVLFHPENCDHSHIIAMPNPYLLYVLSAKAMTTTAYMHTYIIHIHVARGTPISSHHRPNYFRSLSIIFPILLEMSSLLKHKTVF